MKAIRPIYHERFMDIEKSVYSIIHDNLQKYSGEELDDCLETLNQESVSNMREGQEYIGVLAVLFELSEWAKECDYYFSVNNVKDMYFHLVLMGIKLTKLYTDENCIVEIDNDGFFELLDLLKYHWSIIAYDWDFDYEFPEKEEDINITLGPITIKPWLADDAIRMAKITSEWAEELNVQYLGPNDEEYCLGIMEEKWTF